MPAASRGRDVRGRRRWPPHEVGCRASRAPRPPPRSAVPHPRSGAPPPFRVVPSHPLRSMRVPAGHSRARVWLMTVHSRTAAIGQPAPDFTLTDQHGTEFHLAEALAEGPVVLVFLRGFG